MIHNGDQNKKTERPKHSEPILIRVSPTMKEQIEHNAAKYDVTLATICRWALSAWSGQPPTVRKPAETAGDGPTEAPGCPG